MKLSKLETLKFDNRD